MPKQFVWDDKYSVKVPSLDAQHKRFFQLTNDILLIVDDPINADLKRKLILLIVEFGNYALNHLTYEEHCTKSSMCSGQEDHLVAHDSYRERVKGYLRDVVKPETDLPTLAKEVAEFSQSWLSGHILNIDRGYIECLTQHHVK